MTISFSLNTDQDRRQKFLSWFRIFAMQGVMLNYELASPVTYVVNMQGMEMAEVKKVMVGAQKVYDNKV